MTASAIHLTTFAELEQLPDPPGGRWELRKGELVPVAPAKKPHYAIQLRLNALLLKALGDLGTVGYEMGFRPHPEYEYRIADVAFLSKARWDGVVDGYIHGAPEIFIEVLSPSNTASEMNEKERICLENGCREFWLVDLKRREVKVTTSDGQVRYYSPDQQIPLHLGGTVDVESIFGPIL